MIPWMRNAVKEVDARREGARQALRPAQGYTILEVTVAMVVLGVALSGLFPLAAVLSRDLQPNRAAGVSSPARDWNLKNSGQTPNYRHNWYLLPYDDPWARKLGAGVRLKLPTDSLASTTPLPLPAPTLTQDDDNTVSLDADGDLLEDYSDAGWTYDPTAVAAYSGDKHRQVALPTGSTPVGPAVWTLKIVGAGWYSIQATWPAAADQATDAVFSVTKNGAPLCQTTVNQTIAPSAVSDADGRGWAKLTANPVSLAKDDVIQIQLGDVRATSTETGKYVVADAVRIVQNVVSVTSVDRALAYPNSNNRDADISVKVSVQVNVPQ